MPICLKHRGKGREWQELKLTRYSELEVKKGVLGHAKELTFYLDDKRRFCHQEDPAGS